MNINFSQEQIQLFCAVFSGRTDVFALYWEKGKKSGYMPAYKLDPYVYRRHKMGGGTFQNYPDKTYLPLSADQINSHLEGKQLIGLYVMLPDNTSWLLAADFDGPNWNIESRAFIKTCADFHIPAYLERSRSGEGGHVWVFFDRPYPALRSRKIFIHLLEKTGAFSMFDKDSSFDRLFPNQDFLSGKGLGNLIALPLYKPSLEQGNSCFVNADTLEPFDDQWSFLSTIQRVSYSELDKLYDLFHTANTLVEYPVITDKTNIILDELVHIEKRSLTGKLSTFIKEEFNLPNSEFFIKQKTGKSTWNIPRYFKLFIDNESEVSLPQGSIGKIIRFCKENSIEYNFIDRRVQLAPVVSAFLPKLRANQLPACEAASKKDFGVIVAPPGAGKTVIALKIIADKQQPALIIVHRKQLLSQWIERVIAFLGIPKSEIGIIGQGKNKIGSKITIATIQSLSKVLKEEAGHTIKNAFGTIIIDECHHTPAESFQQTISKINTFYIYGLTATPFRKYSDGKLIFVFLGEIISEILSSENTSSNSPKIVIRETTLDTPFNPKTDKFEVLSRILVHDSIRNKLIANDIQKEISSGRKIVVISERKDHIDVLSQYLRNNFEIISLTGDDNEVSRQSKWKMLQEGQYQVLLTTGQFFGEGTDLQNANCLFLVYPFSFEGKLIQYIGRVQRGEITPIIYDYHDRKIDYLHRLFLKRNMYYRKISYQATLFDDPIDEPLPQTSQIFQETIRVSIEQLEFLYGAVSFLYQIPKMQLSLQFNIDNEHIRPEIEVLKPYFAKVLGTNHIQVEIFAEIDNNEICAQSATSNDFNKINREVIDSVKFRFIEKAIINQTVDDEIKAGLLDESQILQHDNQSNLYSSSEELLNDILSKKSYKHDRQLRYLAEHHERSVLKLRFVLSPFSFVFLLAGHEQYHLILETLDTEEATYIWHVSKNKSDLREALRKIDDDIHIIRQHGRQYFLDTNPPSFSRIMHDYSDEKKGFVVWRDMLEERLR
ncbi:MAG: DEAD/DEAH box helicase [Saprospiraceae bacterium]|nr:DEAD/DEAH box helicase [Saprospiraceae bacterium]